MYRKECITNLLEARNILTESIYRGHEANVIYTDFAKAFDKVPHRRLLQKLKAYGISCKVYVDDSKIIVVIKSDKVVIKSRFR